MHRASYVVDAHTHVFPSADYGRRWQRLVGRQPILSGRVPELLELMERGTIDRSVILLYARSGERFKELRHADPDRHECEVRGQVLQEIRALNRWGCNLAASDDHFIPFVGINVRFMSPEEISSEIDEMVGRGARGVKIIPPSMELYANDPLLDSIYERCSALAIPILSQSGSGGGSPPQVNEDHYGRPKYFADVLRAFPKLKLILAHMGLDYEDDIVDLTSRFPNVYTDTSLRLGSRRRGDLTSSQLVETIRRIGTKRVLFGSNFPMANPADYAKVLRDLPFTQDERDDLLGGNACRVIGLK